MGGRPLILLDTHALVWLDAGSGSLGRRARRAADRALAEGELIVSAISFWEVAMLAAKGRVRIALDLRSWRHDLLAAGLREAPVTGEHGILAANLEDVPGDPADRIVVATALVLGASLLTADRAILDLEGSLTAIDARS